MATGQGRKGGRGGGVGRAGPPPNPWGCCLGLKRELKINVNHGIYYPVTQQEMNEIQDCDANPDLPYFGGNSTREADMIVSPLQLGRNLRGQEVRAAKNMELWKPYLEEEQSNFWVCFKAFNDLDTMFFQGVLRGRVHVRVAYRPDDPNYGDTCPPGHETFRTTITHNPTWVNTDQPTVGRLLAHMLHEMTHAYFDVTGTSDQVSGQREGHGPPFLNVLEEIDKWLRRNDFDIDVLGTSNGYIDRYRTVPYY